MTPLAIVCGGALRADNLIAIVDASIDDSDIDSHAERLAIQREHIDDSDAATTARAIEALRRPPRYTGEHDVARAWLRGVAPTAGIYRREPA